MYSSVVERVTADHQVLGSTPSAPLSMVAMIFEMVFAFFVTINSFILARCCKDQIVGSAEI